MKRKGKIPAAAGVVAACAMLGAGELPGGPLTVEASAAGYYQVLGLDRERRDFDFSATLLATNRPGNLFFRENSRRLRCRCAIPARKR